MQARGHNARRAEKQASVCLYSSLVCLCFEEIKRQTYRSNVQRHPADSVIEVLEYVNSVQLTTARLSALINARSVEGHGHGVCS